MTRADSREASDEELTKHRAQAVETYMPPSNERINPKPDPASLRRRLDVDAVVERSVRKVVTE